MTAPGALKALLADVIGAQRIGGLPDSPPEINKENPVGLNGSAGILFCLCVRKNVGKF